MQPNVKTLSARVPARVALFVVALGLAACGSGSDGLAEWASRYCESRAKYDARLLAMPAPEAVSSDFESRRAQLQEFLPPIIAATNDYVNEVALLEVPTAARAYHDGNLESNRETIAILAEGLDAYRTATSLADLDAISDEIGLALGAIYDQSDLADLNSDPRVREAILNAGDCGLPDA